MQTAVEWFMEQVKSKEWQLLFIWQKEEVFKQAKQMEKEQIEKALPSQLISMLKECRDMLVMCTIIDKSSQCQELVDKVDAKMGW